ARIDANTPAESVLTGLNAGAGEWSRYDQILFPCEGAEYTATAPQNARTNFTNYVNSGGRVFTTHYSYVWLFNNGGFANVGAWQARQTFPIDPLIGTIDN